LLLAESTACKSAACKSAACRVLLHAEQRPLSCLPCQRLPTLLPCLPVNLPRRLPTPTLPCHSAQFDEGCTGDLRAAFGDEPSDIGRLGTDFFASCDEVLPPLLPPSSAGGPAPAPAGLGNSISSSAGGWLAYRLNARLGAWPLPPCHDTSNAHSGTVPTLEIC
jgi:hypothetical protein